MRWAASGYEILIGSRDRERGERAAAEMNGQLGSSAMEVRGGDNLAVAQEADVVVLSVPYKAQRPTLEAVRPALEDKLLVTVVAPLNPSKKSHVWLPSAGSAAQEAQAQLGDSVRVIAAFQDISAKLLSEPDSAIDCDVLICGEDKEDKEFVRELAAAAGMRGLDAGPLQNAAVPEGLAAVLIAINMRNKIKHSGIRITGLPDSE